MMCDSVNERIVAMAITREPRSHGDKRAENQTRAHDASHVATQDRSHSGP
jgi:hypothetical protein